jgi:O-antigen/teichoic acid export membrane protein
MSLKKNIIANYAGAVWAALMGFVFVPFYLKYIGAEGYGLVGFFVMLSATLAILDGGLGAVATRESARYLTADHAQRRDIVLLLRTMEILFWGLALLVGALVVLASPLIVDYWLNVLPVAKSSTSHALRWMSLAVVMQFPLSFYSGCLNGLQKQVGLNLLNIIGATLRSGGAVLVLWLISPTVEAFFAWNALSGVGMVMAYRMLMTSCLRETKVDIWFATHTLNRVKHFMAGVGAINVFALILTQLDKVILSKVLPLESFGYYSLAWTLGTLIYRLIGPIFNAYYPKITQEVERGDNLMIMATYRQSCGLMAIAVVPISLWITIFSKEILFLWTQDPEIAKAASGALSVIAIGTLCNAFMNMPYALQLAYGYIRLGLWQNILTVIIIAPLTWYLATHYGLSAAAVPWLLVNASSVLINPFLMHKYLSLPGLWQWYGKSVFGPTLISAGVMSLSSFYWIRNFNQQFLMIAILSIILGSSFIATLIFTKFISPKKI